MSQATDSAIQSASHAYVIYDKTSGEVLHVHHEVSFPHGAPPSEQPAARALRLAGLAAGGNISVLQVEPAKVNLRAPIQIDLANGTVILKQKSPKA